MKFTNKITWNDVKIGFDSLKIFRPWSTLSDPPEKFSEEVEENGDQRDWQLIRPMMLDVMNSLQEAI